MTLNQLAERPVGDQGSIPVYDEQHALFLFDVFQSDPHSVTRPELLLLQNRLGVLRKDSLDLFRLMAHHHHQLLRAQGPDCFYSVVHHRRAAESVEHLCLVRFHPGSFAARKDHGEYR